MSEFEEHIFNLILIGGFIAAVISFAILMRFTAPYGRYMRPGWGPEVPRKIGWVLMELPASLVFAIFFLAGSASYSAPAWIFLFLWQSHYIPRSLIFPFRLRPSGKTNPLVIVCMAILFNLCNGYINGRYLRVHAGSYTNEWLRDPRFITGLALFVFGFVLNQHSDAILLRLRKPGETGFKIPFGGAFRYVSCPNYLGEIVEWIGWAVLTWSIPGLLFAVWTGANLIPRARSHHRWYREKFEDYPRDRKILVPFLY